MSEEVRYEIGSKERNILDRWHYHGFPKDPERFVELNDATKNLARMIMVRCPDSRNRSLAITALEEVRMRANAAIAVDEQYL